MVLRDIYNVVGVAAQDTFFSEEFSIYEVVNANTEGHYRCSRAGDTILLGGDTEYPLTPDWVLGLPVVGICAANNHVIIWVDG